MHVVSLPLLLLLLFRSYVSRIVAFFNPFVRSQSAGPPRLASSRFPRVRSRSYARCALRWMIGLIARRMNRAASRRCNSPSSPSLPLSSSPSRNAPRKTRGAGTRRRSRGSRSGGLRVIYRASSRAAHYVNTSHRRADIYIYIYSFVRIRSRI